MNSLMLMGTSDIGHKMVSSPRDKLYRNFTGPTVKHMSASAIIAPIPRSPGWFFQFSVRFLRGLLRWTRRVRHEAGPCQEVGRSFVERAFSLCRQVCGSDI